MADGVVTLTEATWNDEVTGAKGAVVVYFWAPWCGHCKAFAPVFEEVAREFGGAMKIARLNCDENGGLASRCGIMGTPTMAFFRDGKEVDRVVGALPREELRAKIEGFLKPGGRKK